MTCLNPSLLAKLKLQTEFFSSPFYCFFLEGTNKHLRTWIPSTIGESRQKKKIKNIVRNCQSRSLKHLTIHIALDKSTEHVYYVHVFYVAQQQFLGVADGVIATNGITQLLIQNISPILIG